MKKISLLALLLTFAFQCTFSQEIALTFDDAPMDNGAYFKGAERTSKIIAQLKEHNVAQAAFFVITQNIQSNSGLPRLEKYVKAGHLLANHTHSHQWIHQIGTATYIDDIKKADAILKKINGYTPWFRYPFLDEGRTTSSRDSIRAALKELKLSNGYVTVDNYDWYINGQIQKAIASGKKINEPALKELYIEHIWASIQFYDQVAKQHLGRSPKHVLLLHENDLTAKFIGDLIDHIRAHGWKIISPIDAYKDPVADLVPDVLFNGQGRIAAIAKEKGVAGRDLVQSSEDEEFLDRLIVERKIFE